MKYKDKILGDKYGLFILLSIFIIIISFVSSIATTTNSQDAVKFALFQIGGILIPGLAIQSLFPIKCKTREEWLLLAYVDGYILSMLMYLIVMFFSLDAYVVLLYVGIALTSIMIIAVKNKEIQIEQVIYTFDSIPWVFLCVLLLISWLFFSMRWSVSLYTTEFSNDGLFWIGDIISLDKKFLPIDFRLLEQDRKYHYGGAMQLALACKVTGISAFNMGMHFSYIQSMVLLTFSGYCVAKRFIKDRTSVVLMLFLFFFSTGIEDRSFVTYLWHIFIQPMSFNIALSLEFVILLLIVIQLDAEKIDYKILGRVILAVLVCTITKGPAGAIATCMVGVVCIWWLVGKKEIKKSILYGVFVVTAFLSIYIFLADVNASYVRNDAVVESSADDKGAVEEQAVESSFGTFDKLKKIISYVGGYLLYVSYVNPWTFIPAAIYFLYCVINKKAELLHWICALLLTVGTILGYSINYIGKSQMYFTLAVCPFAALLTGVAVEEIICNWQLGKHRRIMVGGSCCLILFCSCIGAYRHSIEETVVIGTTNLFQRNYDSMQGNYRYDKMDYAEHEVYEWIRLNTQEDALFLSDRMLEDEMMCWVPGVFCERYVYNYRVNEYECARSFFRGEEASISYFADKGVRYIIQNKHLSPEFNCADKIARKLFENQSVAVYELKDSKKWKNL